MSVRCLFKWLSGVSLALAMAAAPIGGCADNAPLGQPQFVTTAANIGGERAYRIGIGDQLKITVFGEENLSGQFEVNALGQLSMPLIGELQAKGLTLQELRDQLVKRLSDGFLKSPKVTADILNYRPIYVHGEVRSGGEFKFKAGLSLRDAIAMAGGYTYRANQDYIYIGREGEPDATVKTMSGFVILPGDNIRIPERFF